MDALFGHIHLVLAHGLAGGHDLAVQVGQADLVIMKGSIFFVPPPQELISISRQTPIISFLIFYI